MQCYGSYSPKKEECLTCEFTDYCMNASCDDRGMTAYDDFVYNNIEDKKDKVEKEDSLINEVLRSIFALTDKELIIVKTRFNNPEFTIPQIAQYTGYKKNSVVRMMEVIKNKYPCIKPFLTWKKRKKKPRKSHTLVSVRKRERPVLCVETNCVYRSIQDAANKMGIPYQNLYNAIRIGHRCHGYTWEDVSERTYYTKGRLEEE